MIRRSLPAAALVLSVAAAAAVVLLVFTGRGDRPIAPPADGATLEATIAPTRLLFGDQAVAELTLVLDRRLVPLDTLSVNPRFGPFRSVAPVERERADAGDVTVLRYRYLLQCLDRACAVGGEERTFELPLAIIRYSRLDRGVVSDPVAWPALTVVSRLRPGEALDPALATRPSPAPALSFAVAPTVLGWLAGGAAAALVLGVGAAVALVLVRRSPRRGAVAPAVEPAGSAVDVALALVGAAADQGAEEDRRIALDELAGTLDAAGLSEAASEVRRLAWSPRPPDGGEMRALEAVVRRALEEAA